MISLAHKNRTFLNSTSLKQDQSSPFLHSARNKIIKKPPELCIDLKL